MIFSLSFQWNCNWNGTLKVNNIADFKTMACLCMCVLSVHESTRSFNFVTDCEWFEQAFNDVVFIYFFLCGLSSEVLHYVF